MKNARTKKFAKATTEPTSRPPLTTEANSNVSCTARAPSPDAGFFDRSWRRSLVVAVLAVLVFGFSYWDSSSQLRSSPFHPDESRWINRAYYLRKTLDPLGPAWSDRYLIRGQPPMGSYVTGLGLLAHGRDLNTNGPWDFQYGFESNAAWNVTRGNMPAEGDLIAVRRTNMVISAFTCVALFLIVSQLTNLAGGVAAAVFFAVNPLNQYLATLATSDAVFTCFVALSVLAAVWLAKRPSWWRALLFALAMAAGASTKLSPLALAVGLGIAGAVLLLDPWLRQLPTFGRAWSWISRVEHDTGRRLGWMLAVQPVLVAMLFVMSYPYLWPAPIERTRILFEFRRFEMTNQAGFWPQAAIGSRVEAVERTWQNLNDRFSSSDRIVTVIGDALGLNLSGLQIDLYLAAPGILFLVYLAWKNGIASPHALAAMTVVGQSALILGALGVDFNRYYLPLLFTAAMGVGFFIGCIGEWVLVAFRRRSQRRASPVFQRSNTRLETVPATKRYQG
ncbi:hypothetical protein BH24CHL4_BH24CHL4_14290 [soil metagenome]